GSALDQEAAKRGNSVYFPGRVVPMLPEALSNGLCSLNPNTDRLAMVCEVNVSAAGRAGKYVFYEAVFQSHARLTYTKVGQHIEGEHLLPRKELHKPLNTLYDLYKALRKSRELRGAIDFETTETRIVFGHDKKIERIEPVQRNEAHKVVEECMLCANVCAARFLEKQDIAGMYRIHDSPGEEKLINLRAFLAELGLSLGGGAKPKPADYQALAAAISGRSDRHIIQTMMLRSMMQAVYDVENKGHFGLAYPAYTHFTSPIRRYPDLLVHRAIRSIIRSRKPSDLVTRVRGAKPLAQKNIFPYDTQRLLSAAEQCSMTERRADDATRDVTAWLKCEYLLDRIGEVFSGTVNAVTGFGLFVELEDIFVEGLVHVTALNNDYYHFDAAKQRLLGERTGVVYRLGDPLTVKLVAVNLEDKKIDLEPAGDAAASKPAGKGKGRAAGKPSASKGPRGKGGKKRKSRRKGKR
ncbi:MAG: ribonuclease R family protein, partial [Pseudomonadales bacterium]